MDAKSASLGAENQVALSPFVPVILCNGDVRVQTVALLDTGCETSLMDREIARSLGLQGVRRQIQLGTFHGADPRLDIRVAACRINSTYSNKSLDISRMLIVPKLQDAASIGRRRREDGVT